MSVEQPWTDAEVELVADAPEQTLTGGDVASVAHALHIRSCPHGVYCSEAPTGAEFGTARAILSAAGRLTPDSVDETGTDPSTADRSGRPDTEEDTDAA